MIPFNKPPVTGNELGFIQDALGSNKLSGDGAYGKRCQSWFEDQLGCPKALLTPSCTAALEMAAVLIDIKPGDEVIMPSYTFVSTANAFALRGASIVFVDIRADTMNIDERLIESAITDKTIAIVPVHYAGVACEMDEIMAIATRHDLYVIEDAAQGMMASYKGRPLGTIGHMGTFSFHETKNYTSGGEGGLLIVNDRSFESRAEVVREKGTNRSQFFRGQIDKYTWVDVGSSYLPSEIQAAYLWAQLQAAQNINESRLARWEEYYEGFKPLEESGCLTLPGAGKHAKHNAHMFYIKLANHSVRGELIAHLKALGVYAVFHYVPLHSAPAGQQFGRFDGLDRHTTKESARLLRLPMYFGLSEQDVSEVISGVKAFFKK